MRTRKTISLQEHAMRYGTFMGVFWIIKFTFFPMGFNVPFLLLLFFMLSLFVPILGFIYARKFRTKYCEGEISFIRAFIFTLFMYIFAALLVAVAHYIYFRFIDHGFLANTYLEQLEHTKSIAKEEILPTIEQLIQTVNAISSLSPLQLTFQLIFQNIFYGFLLAIPTALLVMKRKKQI